MKDIKIYFRFLRMQLLTGMEYRGWWLTVLQSLLFCIMDPLGTVLLFQRFGNIGPWSVERILLIYSMAVTSYGLAQCFCQGFDQFPEQMIRTGGFDRLLLRPKSLFTQTAASFFYLHRFSRPVAGIAVILWCLGRQGVPLTPRNITILLLALLGGFATYAGVEVFSAGAAFFSIKGMDWREIFTAASYQVARIPHDYMPGTLKAIFTFVMPMLVISYYPASVICGWGASLWTGLLALPAGLVFLGAAVAFWRVGVVHYKSTGS